MRAVVQRVSSASVHVDDELISQIGRGLLVLVGVAKGDGEADVSWLADKLLSLRIFENEFGKFDRSVVDVAGEMLVVSQFTLYGDVRKGRRPSFSDAAAPGDADLLYRSLIERLRNTVPVRSGRFGAHMRVTLVNDGPVTILLDNAT